MDCVSGLSPVYALIAGVPKATVPGEEGNKMIPDRLVFNKVRYVLRHFELVKHEV